MIMRGEPNAMSTNSEISLRAFAPHNTPAWLAYSAPALDRLLGIQKVDRIYREHHLQGLPPFEFVEQGLLAFGLTVQSEPGQLDGYIPAQGPVLVVCNHPYGGVEALAIAHLLKTVRTDIKILANTGLRVIPELWPLIIATNPLKVSQRNLPSIRECESHLTQGGLLVVFPAGRVSFRPRGGDRIHDAEWNRIVGHLAKRTKAALLPVFFSGANSPLFHVMGNLWDRSKLLMLPREFLRLRGKTIHLYVGHPIAAKVWRHLDVKALTRYARLMTYLLESRSGRKSVSAPSLAPLAPLSDPALIECELAALPDKQRLLDFKQFSVFYARAGQIPFLMQDIARERERVFRLYDEGSGEPRDGDDLDQVYVQLFVWDNRKRSLVGAYRLGRTDLLRVEGASGVYLTQMFEIDDAFYDTGPPALELGRSFVVPEHQKSFHSLYLLWRGIGCYLVAHPQYRRLYGTVSLSRQYDDRAIALICDALIEPSPHVRPRHALTQSLHPEWYAYRKAQGKLDLRTLSACVRGLDREGKDLPVLLKHYYKLGAKFHCVAVDPNFNHTPGLLLSVDMETVPEKLLSTFLGKDAPAYLAYTSDTGVRVRSQA